MNKINSKTVTVSTSEELKEALENNNGYEYIYLENDITLKSGIAVNSNKKKDNNQWNLSKHFTHFNRYD